METKKQTEQELLKEFQRKFNKKRMLGVWLPLFFFQLVIGMVMLPIASVLNSELSRILVISIGELIVITCTIAWYSLKRVSLHYDPNSLKQRIEQEIEKLKGSQLLSEIEIGCHSTGIESTMNPLQEQFNKRQDEIMKFEIEIKFYNRVPERNFRQYIKSFKWIKKIK